MKELIGDTPQFRAEKRTWLQQRADGIMQSIPDLSPVRTTIERFRDLRAIREELRRLSEPGNGTGDFVGGSWEEVKR